MAVDVSHWTSSSLGSVHVSSFFPWTLISKSKALFTSFGIEDLGPLANGSGVLLLGPIETLPALAQDPK